MEHKEIQFGSAEQLLNKQEHIRKTVVKTGYGIIGVCVPENECSLFRRTHCKEDEQMMREIHQEISRLREVAEWVRKSYSLRTYIFLRTHAINFKFQAKNGNQGAESTFASFTT